METDGPVVSFTVSAPSTAHAFLSPSLPPAPWSLACVHHLSGFRVRLSCQSLPCPSPATWCLSPHLLPQQGPSDDHHLRAPPPCSHLCQVSTLLPTPYPSSQRPEGADLRGSDAVKPPRVEQKRLAAAARPVQGASSHRASEVCVRPWCFLPPGHCLGARTVWPAKPATLTAWC